MFRSKKNVVLLTALSIVLLLAGCLGTKQNAQVTGTVSYADDAPLPGALVKLGDKATHTDHEGRFSLSGVRFGTYDVTVHLDDTLLHSEKVEIDSSQVTLSIELTEVAPRGDIIGTVINAEEEPVSGADVSIGSMTESANAEGQFIFSDVPYGRYNVTVTVDGVVTSTIEVQLDRDEQHVTVIVGDNIYMLASFEEDDEQKNLYNHGVANARRTDRSTHGDYSLRAIYTSNQDYPALRLYMDRNERLIIQDWSVYEYLAFDLWNDASDPVTLNLKFHHVDGSAVDKSLNFELQPYEWTSIKEQLSDIDGLDTSQVNRLDFWMSAPGGDKTIHIFFDNIHLGAPAS